MALDVTGDSFVSPLDVLAVINAINLIKSDSQTVAFAEMFLDTNGDGILSPLDALLVINFLNRSGQVGGEGEASSSFAPLIEIATSNEDSINGPRKANSLSAVRKF